MRPLASFFARPAMDAWRGLDRCLAAGWGGLARVALGLAAGWWLYVPLHELLHATACLAAGGGVSRLEIAPLYGGALLAHLVPFVVAGGDYAGRLAGFDTRGSDLVYLATDLGPYLLTLFPGVWLLRRAGDRGRGVLFGLALAPALAPFLSATGDAYEIGSIWLTRWPAWSSPAAREALRGDDLFRVASRLAGSGGPAVWTPWVLWAGLVLAAAAGLLWAFATYAAGAGLAKLLSAPGSPPPDAR